MKSAFMRALVKTMTQGLIKDLVVIGMIVGIVMAMVFGYLYSLYVYGPWVLIFIPFAAILAEFGKFYLDELKKERSK